MTQDTEKKIIVDEDWKGQVEREREAALKAASGQSSAAEPGPSAAGQPDADTREHKLPPATLSYLSSTLYFQAAIYLGLMPNPASGKAEKNLAAAKHAIDVLDVLQQKTEGNRTAEESDEIDAMLHQLRMAYVQITAI
jgi:hypothetical protein